MTIYCIECHKESPRTKHCFIRLCCHKILALLQLILDWYMQLAGIIPKLLPIFYSYYYRVLLESLLLTSTSCVLSNYIQGTTVVEMKRLLLILRKDFFVTVQKVCFISRLLKICIFTEYAVSFHDLRPVFHQSPGSAVQVATTCVYFQLVDYTFFFILPHKDKKKKARQ